MAVNPNRPLVYPCISTQHKTTKIEVTSDVPLDNYRITPHVGLMSKQWESQIRDKCEELSPRERKQKFKWTNAVLGTTIAKGRKKGLAC